MSFSPNRKTTVSAATLNCIAKARVNLFLLGWEYSRYVNYMEEFHKATLRVFTTSVIFLLTG